MAKAETKKTEPVFPLCENCGELGCMGGCRFNKKCDPNCTSACCSKKFSMWRVLKMVVMLFILVLIFTCGVAVGKKVGDFKTYTKTALSESGFSVDGFNGMMGGRMLFRNNGEAVESTSPVSGGNIMFQRVNKNGVNISGVIEKIEGNKITLTDNSDATQVIYSIGKTVISNSTKLLPLSALKAKQFIVSTVTVNSGSNEALTIQVVE